MKKTATATTKRQPLTGADHLCLILLSQMNGGMEPYDSRVASRYLEAARAILQSPRAFDGGSDTLSVCDYVLKSGLQATGPATECNKRHNALVDRIFAEDTHDHDSVTGEAQDLRSIVYFAISESTLYGAALMYELLKGVAR